MKTNTTQPRPSDVAREIAVMADRTSHNTNQVSVSGFIIRLVRIDHQRRLTIARRDRQPSAEEALIIAAAAGAPEEADPIATFLSITNQDSTRFQRCPALVITWRQISDTSTISPPARRSSEAVYSTAGSRFEPPTSDDLRAG